ncbi:MAG: MFS transporter [Holosporales bacterium]|nr:MFS transporter [Holosporales bacterium]
MAKRKFARNGNESTSDNSNSYLEPIPRMVWLIGIIMFCANIASTIVYAYGGVYLKEKMGFSTLNVGVLEGIAEGTSHLMKLVSGVFSDMFQRRKTIMVIGYGIIVIARYLLAFGSRFPLPIILARLAERIGNGIQAAPRSALVGDISPQKRIGACYGLKRSLATIGSFTGAVVAMVIMIATNNNYQVLFGITAIPATIGLILLLAKVKDPSKLRHAAVLSVIPSHAPKYRPTFKVSNFKFLGNTFWKLMAVNFIFLLSRMGETFLMLYGRFEFHLDPKMLATIMMVFNMAWSLSSYPVGRIADNMNRYWLLCLGIGSLILADLVLSTATVLPTFYLGVTLWGIQYGTTQNIFLSLINETVPENLRGTGLGVYWIISACTTTLCDTIMGYIVDWYGSTRAAFIASGIVSIFGLMSLIIIMGYKIRDKR